MESQKIDTFLAMNAKKLSPVAMNEIRKYLETADDSKSAALMSLDLKDPDTMLLISVLIGGLGIDRFMLGDIGMGVLKLLTGGLCGILWIIDFIGVREKTKEYNYRQFMEARNMGLL